MTAEISAISDGDEAEKNDLRSLRSPMGPRPPQATMWLHPWLELFFVQAWLIWTQRNTIIFGGMIQDPSRLLAVTSGRVRCSRWTPLSGSSFKLNFDAAVFQDIKASRFGAVIRNYLGELMAALSARGPPVEVSEEEEVLACRKALEFTIDSGFSDIVIEGDNTIVMAAISSSRLIHSQLGHLYVDIHCLTTGIHVHSVSCVARSANSVAHCSLC
ncbi:uncharacterized protein LOC136070855 [Quercus suber]|uniref:uncharacterized protein LOC136070855 n=1 Tax=Quercus suber TaxID=58331 RepID=UPI0032DF8D34